MYESLKIFKKNDHEANAKDDIDFKDSSWVVNSFMSKNRNFSSPDNVNRYWSIVSTKFTDTSLGGNIAVNPPPQFTRYADIKAVSKSSHRNPVRIGDLKGNIGMGRYYGEAIDDNGVDAFFTYGIPEFNNSLSFAISSVDYRQSVIANSGRAPIGYDIGNIWGTAVLFVAFPIIGPLLWTANKAYDILIGPGKTSYYYLKPAMSEYWSTVNTIANMMATELGFVAPEFTTKGSASKSIGSPLKLSTIEMDAMRDYMPDLISNRNYIDVMAIVTKAQRMANQKFMTEMDMYASGAINTTNFTGLVKSNIIDKHDLKQTSFASFVNELSMSKEIYKRPKTIKVNKEISTKTDNKVNKQFTANADGTLPLPERPVDTDSYINAFKKTYDSVVREGALYAVYRVDNPGNVSESFRNTTTDIALEGALKGISNKVKSVKYSMSGGNILPGMDKIFGYVNDTLHGALNGVSMGLSNVATSLEGGGNIYLDKRWDDSSATFPAITFKTKLIAPYNHPLSKYKNIYLPLAMLLAGALPRSTGNNSYTTPFHCSMFLRGRQHVSNGIVTTLTITRGTSNLPFDKQKQPLAIDVSWTVSDLSKMMPSPTPQGIFDAVNTSFNDDNPLNRYIAALCGRNLYNTNNAWPKTKLRLSRIFNQAEFALSPSAMAMRVGSNMPDFYKNVLSAKSVNYTTNF